MNAFAHDVPSDRLLDDTRVLTGALTLAPGAGANVDARRGFYDRVVARIAALPGVTAVSVTSHLPLSGASGRRVYLAVQVHGAVLLGLLLGLTAAIAWDRAFVPARQTALRVADPLVLAVALCVLALVVALGCALPIRRAVGVSPADVLREE